MKEWNSQSMACNYIFKVKIKERYLDGFHVNTTSWLKLHFSTRSHSIEWCFKPITKRSINEDGWSVSYRNVDDSKAVTSLKSPHQRWQWIHKSASLECPAYNCFLSLETAYCFHNRGSSFYSYNFFEILGILWVP